RNRTNRTLSLLPKLYLERLDRPPVAVLSPQKKVVSICERGGEISRTCVLCTHNNYRAAQDRTRRARGRDAQVTRKHVRLGSVSFQKFYKLPKRQSKERGK